MKRFVHVFSEREASFTEWLYKTYQEVRAWADWGTSIHRGPSQSTTWVTAYFQGTFCTPSRTHIGDTAMMTPRGRQLSFDSIKPFCGDKTR
jgi:hypothetical protein